MSGPQWRPQFAGGPGLPPVHPALAGLEVTDAEFAEAMAAGPGAVSSLPEPMTITDALHLDLTTRIAAMQTIWSTLLGFLGINDADLPDDLTASIHHLVVLTIAAVAGAADETEYFDV